MAKLDTAQVRISSLEKSLAAAEAEQQREILAPCHGEQRNRQGEGKRHNVDYHAKLGGVPQPHLQMRHTASCTKQSREREVKTFEEDC